MAIDYDLGLSNEIDFEIKCEALLEMMVRNFNGFFGIYSGTAIEIFNFRNIMTCMQELYKNFCPQN
jgi:hypothetical protein